MCSDKVKIFIESTELLDSHCFDEDYILQKQLFDTDGFEGHKLGIVLIPPRHKCTICEGHLLVRPSYPVIYTDNFGTVNGTRFYKYCSNNWKVCSFSQHYGFHTSVNESAVSYDHNCLQLLFFLPSNKTAFQMKMLHMLSAEILLG